MNATDDRHGALGAERRSAERLGSAGNVEIAVVDLPIVEEAEAAAVSIRELVGISNHFDVKADRPQPIAEVATVQAKVIVLPVCPFAILWGRDRIVLEGVREGELDRMLEDGSTRGSQDPAELPHRPHIVGNVLEDVAAQDEVEAVIRIRDLLHGELGHATRAGEEIGRHVPLVAPEMPIDAVFGRDVKQSQRRSEEPVVAEVEVLGPMASQRPAAWAPGVAAGSAERAKVPGTARALDAVPALQQ
jgi:hypothetical protein